MPSFLDINVRQLVAQVSHPDDARLAGRYRVDFTEAVQAMQLALAKQAALALEVFHTHWGFETLDDFAIDVIDADGTRIPAQPDYKDDVGMYVAAIEKVSDTATEPGAPLDPVPATRPAARLPRPASADFTADPAP